MRSGARCRPATARPLMGGGESWQDKPDRQSNNKTTKPIYQSLTNTHTLPPLTTLICIGVGAVLAGQLWIGGPKGADWYRFYIMVAGAAILGAGIMLIGQPETELGTVIIGIIFAFLAGGTGITIGLIKNHQAG